MVFDDSYEHEVWNKTDKERVLLLFDLWHPELEQEVSEQTHNGWRWRWSECTWSYETPQLGLTSVLFYFWVGLPT